MLWGARRTRHESDFFQRVPADVFIGRPAGQFMNWIKDLKGKLIGIRFIGSLGHKITVRVLRKLGIDPDKEVRMVAVGGDASRVQQLRGKQVDATMINPPLSIMMRKEGFNLLLQAGDYVDVPLTGLGTTTKKIKERPEQVRNVLRALYEGLRFVRTNRQETVEIFSRWLKMEPAIAGETYDLAIKMLSPDGLMSDESVLAAMEIFSDNPKELENVSLGNAVDFSLLRAVIKEYEK